ncbi:hypothetical protein KRX57_01610 [Weeksellaceae bacterium TAE3-ERU29]|nr:hypothetical protein [Weeksellaceae bacterium TAE3-ERU29]
MNYTKIISLILLNISIFLFSQEKVNLSILNQKVIPEKTTKINNSNDSLSYNVDIVILEDKTLLGFLPTLNLDKYCMRENEYWYLDYTKKDYILLSKSRIQNKIKLLNSNKDFYLTIIDNNLLFVYGEYLDQFTKTGLKVDISHLINLPPIFIEESSFWILRKDKDEINILLKRNYGCY